MGNFRKARSSSEAKFLFHKATRIATLISKQLIKTLTHSSAAILRSSMSYYLTKLVRCYVRIHRVYEYKLSELVSSLRRRTSIFEMPFALQSMSKSGRPAYCQSKPNFKFINHRQQVERRRNQISNSIPPPLRIYQKND